MSIYEDQLCPVCNREFVDGDDIVVCPECGTPHHRECYNMIGHCVNRGLHKANYDYNEEAKQIKRQEEKTASQASNEYYVPNSENTSTDNNAEDSNRIPNPFVIPDVDPQFANDREKIDGEDIADIASTVRVNAFRYVSVFKKLDSQNKKASWNWSAFFFGSFYLLYRKMYQIGIGVYSIVLALFYGASALIYKVAPEFMNNIAQLAEMAVQKITPTTEQIESVMASSDVNKANMVVYAMLGIIFVIHIIIGIFADSIYKKQVLGIVKSVKKNLEDGASFTQASVGFGPNSIEMSQEQLKKMYLSRKGGTSFMAPALALLVLSFIL